MKKCTVCNIDKDFSEYRKDKHHFTGCTSRCKECLTKNILGRSFPRKQIDSKKCMHCQIEKPNNEFCNNKSNNDGMHVWCKECSRKKAKEYRLKNPDNWERQRQKNFVNWRNEIGVEPEIKIRNKAGEGSINKQGYLTFRKKDHPCADKNGRVQASHLVVYENTGRLLKKGESVHHKNGHRLDNRIENLEVWSTSQPAGQRIEDKIHWSIEFLDKNGYDVKKRESI